MLTDAERGHYLRQFGPVGVETAAIFPTRLPGNRGNAYFDPTALTGERNARMIFPSLDCENSGGERTTAKRGTRDPASCFVQELLRATREQVPAHRRRLQSLRRG